MTVPGPMARHAANLCSVVAPDQIRLRHSAVLTSLVAGREDWRTPRRYTKLKQQLAREHSGELAGFDRERRSNAQARETASENNRPALRPRMYRLSHQPPA